MLYADKFEAFSLIKNGSNYNLVPFSQDKLKNNVNQLQEESKIKEEEKIRYSIKRKNNY